MKSRRASGPLTELEEKTLITLLRWWDFEHYCQRDGDQGMPRNTYIYAKEGSIYIRWTPRTPGHQARFIIARITVEEDLRSQGIFTSLLLACCRTKVPVIRVECVQNPRLWERLIVSKIPKRRSRQIESYPRTIDFIHGEEE